MQIIYDYTLICLLIKEIFYEEIFEVSYVFDLLNEIQCGSSKN